MSDKQRDDQKTDAQDRRQFLKAVGATAVATGLGIPQAVATEDATVSVDDEYSDLHICRGLNTKEEGGQAPGAALATNIPAADLHGCAGGNTCRGLGGCGTGEYARQYWVSENNCGKTGSTWDGTGGCGVPLGSTNTGFICSQLNNAVPTPAENPKGLEPVLVGVPVWAIARSRFEAKMVKSNKAFAASDGCGDYKGNSWSPGDEYSRGKLPEPYPEPVPDKLAKPTG